MNKDEKQTEIKRGRGRPSLSPEEKEKRRIAKNKRINEYHKASGYAANKKYEALHPEKAVERNRRRRKEYCDITVPIFREFKHLIDEIATTSGTTLASIFLSAVEEKYNIKLTKD